MNLDDVVRGYVDEAEFDYVGLWQIAQTARERLHATDIRRISLDIVRRLYQEGLRAGNYEGGDFDYWPDEGCQAMLDRIEREWIRNGVDPNLAEPICWFAPRSQ